MCIMEIHAHSERTTMVQAIAHNLSTIDRDLDMLREVAHARQDTDLLDFAETVQRRVQGAYAEALAEFGIEVAKVASDHEGHVHGETGSERTFVEIVNNATKAARRAETR